MNHRNLLTVGCCFIAVGYCFLFPAQAKAQDSLTYDLTTETAVGTGDFTAYQLVTNRHHVLATRPNTAYLRGTVNATHAFNEDWKLSGCVDACTLTTRFICNNATLTCRGKISSLRQEPANWIL